MPLLKYRRNFARLVLSGEKRQTIRAERKRLFVPGDRLYHYVGLRTSRCKKLGESICTEVAQILIDEKGDIYIAGRCLYESAKESFAYADGFRTPGSLWAQMLNFFQTVHGLPFYGQLIKWNDLK